jgi:uncharacterized protein YcaQ
MARKTHPRIHPDQVHAFRLRRHHLLDTKPAGIVRIAGEICGIQAQIMSSAQMALWTRNHSVTREEIETALWQKRSLVKTYLMRRTLHLVPARDFSLYIAALRQSRVAPLLRVMARFGVDQNEADALTGLIVELLASGPMSKTALSTAVKPKVSMRVRAWMDKVSSIFPLPAAEGLICYADDRGGESVFVRVDQWLPKQKAISAEAAQIVLFRRYLRAYGPATVQDFAHWSGVPMTQVKQVRELLRDELAVTGEDGKDLLLKGDYETMRSLSPAGPTVRLLPGFDPYLLAHAVKEHMLEPRFYKQVYRNQGWISPVILIGGKVAGIWSHRMQGGRVVLDIKPFARPSPKVRNEIDAEAARLLKFLERAG